MEADQRDADVVEIEALRVRVARVRGAGVCARLAAVACCAGIGVAAASASVVIAGVGVEAAVPRAVVLATRTEPNSVKANTEFWAETLDVQLRDKGYTADGTRAVKTARGLDGTQLRYVTSKNGREHRYWITVFATKKKVFVVEAAGDKEVFDKSTAAVDRAIASLDATD